MIIYIDIETIPSQRPGMLDRMRGEASTKALSDKPPANYKKEEAIIAWREKHIESAINGAEDKWRYTALSPNFGEIICICWAVDDGPIQTSSRATVEESESDVLARCFASLRGAMDERPNQLPVFCGYKVGFDLRFLHHRAVVTGVFPPFTIPYNAAPWQGHYVDIMHEWCGTDRENRIKLIELCDVLGIEVKDSIDGAGVWDAFQGGSITLIEEHCIADVERVRQIDKRMRWA